MSKNNIVINYLTERPFSPLIRIITKNSAVESMTLSDELCCIDPRCINEHLITLSVSDCVSSVYVISV